MLIVALLTLVAPAATHVVISPVDNCLGTSAGTWSWAIAQAADAEASRIELSTNVTTCTSGSYTQIPQNTTIVGNATVRSVTGQMPFTLTGGGLQQVALTVNGAVTIQNAALANTTLESSMTTVSVSATSVTGSIGIVAPSVTLNNLSWSGPATITAPNVSLTSVSLENATLNATGIITLSAVSLTRSTLNVQPTSRVVAAGPTRITATRFAGGPPSVWVPHASAPAAPIVTGVIASSSTRANVHATATFPSAGTYLIEVYKLTSAAFAPVYFTEQTAIGPETRDLVLPLTAALNEQLFVAISSSTGTSAFTEPRGVALDTITLASPVLAVDEDGGSVEVVFNRLFKSGAQTFTVATTNGTATAGSDYTAFNGEVTFVDGSLTATAEIAITDDDTVEADETFTVRVAVAPTLDVAATGVATVTIIDNDVAVLPLVTFVAPAVTIDESAGAVVIGLQRTIATATGSIPIILTPGTATAGADYGTPTLVAAFAAGSLETTIAIPIVDDDVIEGPETFTVGLGASLQLDGSTASTVTVTITDDESPTVSFAESAVRVDENAGRISLTLNRTFADRELTVPVFTVPGTATAGADYLTFNSIATFLRDSTTATVSISIVDDTTDEPDENFDVVLGAVIGVNVGDPLTITIADNDEPANGDGPSGGTPPDDTTPTSSDDGGCQSAPADMLAVLAVLGALRRKKHR